MSATGKVTTNSTHSTSTFVSALVVGLIVAGVYMAVFFLLHAKNRKLYQTRTILAPESKRPVELPANPMKWFWGIIKEPDIRVFEMNGPDAYFFVRFCRFMSMLLFVYWVLTWVILMPVSAAPPSNNLDGLNIFTFGNVLQQDRWAAHIVVAVFLIAFTLFMIYREYQHFLELRQAYLNSPAHAALARSRTVMVNNLPREYHDAERIKEMAAFVPGPIEQVWLPRKVKPLEKVYDARNKECTQLEKGETKAEKLAAKLVRKGKVQEKSGGEEGDDLIAAYIPEKKRPAHHIGTVADYTLGFFGKKVDTLTYSPQFIREQTEELAVLRKGLDSYELANSAFVRFAKQNDAHMFIQLLKSRSGIKMISGTTELVPEDVIWNNLNMSAYERTIRTIISWALTVGLIIIWAPILAFVGVISNVSALCAEVSFLAWICKLPTPVVGIIQGVLPPVLLAVVFMLLPIILRVFIKLQGEPRQSEIERKLWTRFWCFQIIHGFLIVAIASGLVAALQNIKQTLSQLPTMLADNLPSSSIFFLTFIVTVTFATASKSLSRAIPFIMTKLAFILRGGTPRGAYKYDYKMESISLSTTWPPVALLGVIGIVYSIIQPIAVGFACVGFYLLYLTYKYLLIWVCDQPDALESGGLYYPKGLAAVFAALYIEEVCLAGLFFLSVTPIGYAGGAIIVVMGILTIVFQVYIEWKSKKGYLFLDTAGSTFANSMLSKTATPLSDNQLLEQHAQEANDKAGEQYGNTTGLDVHAFDHPAIWKDMPTVWLADDKFGIGRAEVARLNTEGVIASSEYTHMNEKGYVTVERGPPDEAWYGGMTQH